MARRATLASLLVLLGLLALAPAAQARVSIVPGAVPGGGTQTFAFRLANERTDTTTTRLELTFPQAPAITTAKVAGTKGWTATVTPQGENVGSIVLSGGSVGPRQFEQFLITLGPLPADGRLVLQAVQAYGNGQSEKSAPTIVIGPGNVVGAPPVGGPANPGTGPVAEPASSGGVSFGVLWIALGVAVAFIALVGIRTHLAARDTEPEPETEPDPEHESDAEDVSHAEPEAVSR
jgi:uncharacterized protein YcnI